MPTIPVTEAMPTTDAGIDAQLLDLFFDRVPMGIAVFDTEMRLVRCNRTWVGFFEYYFGFEPDYVSPGKHLRELIPGNEESVAMLADNALAGKVVRQAAHRIDIPGKATYWDVVFAPLFEDGQVVGAVDIVTDATDRVNSLQRLQARIAAFTAIAAGMTIDQPLGATLDEVVARVLATTPAAGCTLISWHDEAAPRPVAHTGRAAPPGMAEALNATLTAAWPDLVSGIFGPSQRIRRIVGFRQRALADERFTPMTPFWSRAAWDDLIVVPLTASGRTFGELHLAVLAGTPITQDDETYLVAIADQAAVAARNAALFAAAASIATLTERQRLSRDLHDSVSQALFSMTLHVAAAERNLASAGIDPSSVPATQIARVRELTSGALAEMRALIFELRPDALAEEGLGAAIGRQAAAMSARTGIPIEVDVPAQHVVLPVGVAENLYRLAVEALNNAVKHAGASNLSVSIEANMTTLRLAVVDDGVGFDVSAAHPGHLGRRTMAERAAAAGAVLTVESRPGCGTRVQVDLPLDGEVFADRRSRPSGPHGAPEIGTGPHRVHRA